MSSPEVAADGKAGFLKKKAGKGPHGFKQWKRKWVLLDAGALSWADSPSAKEKGRIVLDSAWLVRISDPNAGRLEVGDEKELLALQAADVAEARGWVDALQAVRTRRTSRWEDRMLARVGASAGDRERLRAVCETWQDGHLTVVRERAAETGSADAVETAAAAAAAAAGGAVGACASAGAAASVASSGQRLWCVLDRATLWLSAGPRTASTPLGYVALESVETIRSLPGQRSLALLTERGASLTVTADTRKELLQVAPLPSPRPSPALEASRSRAEKWRAAARLALTCLRPPSLATRTLCTACTCPVRAINASGTLRSPARTRRRGTCCARKCSGGSTRQRSASRPDRRARRRRARTLPWLRSARPRRWRPA